MEASGHALVRRVSTVPEFGAVVQETRRLRGWTQAELAQRARVSRRWIIALESGQAGGAEFGRVLAVLSALGIDLALFLPITVGDATRTGNAAPDQPVRPLRREPVGQEPHLDLDAHLATFVANGTTSGDQDRR